MKKEYSTGSAMVKRHTALSAVVSALVMVILLLGACDSGNDDQSGNGATTGQDQAATGQDQNATGQDQNATGQDQNAQAQTPTATAASAAGGQNGTATETQNTSGTVASSANTSDTGTSDVSIITSTQLVTGVQVITDVNVTTNTAVIAQQLITTVITSTNAVSNVNQSSETSQARATAVITSTAELSPETTSGEAIANVDVTPLPPTPTPTIVVKATALVTATRVVTRSIEVTAVATPPAGQTPQAQGSTTTTNTATTNTATSTGTAAGVQEVAGRSILASTLLHTGFNTSDSQVDGDISDLILNLQNGQVLYALLSYGGVLGAGGKTAALPLSALSWGDADQPTLNVEGQRLNDFQGVGDDWPTATDNTWDADIRNFLQGAGIDAGFDSGQTAGQVSRVSQLIGTPMGEGVANNYQIQDFIISLGDGRAAYAILAPIGSAAGIAWRVLPMSAFERTDQGLVLKSDFSQDLLDQAPEFNEGDFAGKNLLDQNFDQAWRDFWAKAGYPVTE